MTARATKSKKTMSEEQRRARTHAQAEVTKRRELSAAGVPYDPRLASGQRDIAVNNIPQTSAKRASVADPANLIKRRSERTDVRVRAIRFVDDLFHRSEMGDFPAPKFERGVDVSMQPAAVPMDRASAKLERDRLGAFVGHQGMRVLELGIYKGMSFTWMQSAGEGQAEKLAVLFVFAVDAAVQFYGIGSTERGS